MRAAPRRMASSNAPRPFQSSRARRSLAKVGNRHRSSCASRPSSASAARPTLPETWGGFAVKFYTDEGNWDLVGNNIPVFFIQDAMKSRTSAHAAKPEPHSPQGRGGAAQEPFWDFPALMA